MANCLNTHKTFLKKTLLSGFVISSLALSGCALVADKPSESNKTTSAKATPSQVKSNSSTTSQDVNKSADANLNLDAATMFEIMAAELLLKRGQSQAAFDTYFPIAKELQTPELGERAFQMAMATYSIDNIELASQLWVSVAPKAAQAWKAAFLLTLRKGEINLAFEQWQTFHQLSEAGLTADIIQTAGKVGAATAKEFGLPFMQKIAQSYAKEWVALYGVGMVASVYGQNQTAISALNQAKELMYKQDQQESESLIYDLLSKVYLTVSPAQEGVDALTPYVEENPTDLLVQERLARLEVQAQDYNSAEQRYAFIVNKEPKAYSSQFALALLQIERQAYDKAEQNLIKVSQNPGYASIAFYYLGIMYQERKNYSQALEYFEQVKSQAYIFDAQLHMAEIYYIQANKVKANELLEAIVADTDKEKIKLLRAKAIFATNENDERKALSFYQQALTVDPQNIDLIKAQSLLLYNLKEYDRYEAALTKAIRLEPNDSSLLNALGYFYVEQNRKMDQAYSLLDKALSMEPNSYYILDSMGWYYYQKGDYQTALSFLEKSFALNKDIEVFLHLVKAYWAKGDKDKAKNLWQQYQLKFNKNEQVQNIIKDLEKM